MSIKYQVIILTACLSSVCGAYAADTDNNSIATPATTSSPASNSETETAHFSNPTKPIFVRAATSQFTLKLQSTPSTGYSWFLRGFDHDLLQVVSHKYYPVQNQAIGASGYEEWIFKATPSALIAPQITHLTFTYSRPWEADKGDRTRFTIVTG